MCPFFCVHEGTKKAKVKVGKSSITEELPHAIFIYQRFDRSADFLIGDERKEAMLSCVVFPFLNVQCKESTK
ncbi:hypothetical protein DV713_05355 [Parageobacillus thermoglucosidasius]|nr:hypothetical protein DV713_05355 [Parageobacillus thermoglucosidasius]